jgi:hypothetical protein
MGAFNRRRFLVTASAAAAALGMAPAAFADEPAPLPANRWPLNEHAGYRAADVVAGRTAVLHNGVTFGPGRDRNAAFFDGVDDYGLSRAVDIRTDQSFTVAAWVRLAEKNFGRAIAVSVDGDRTSKFELGFIQDDDENQLGEWIFSAPESDVDQPLETAFASGTLPAEVDTWTHLVGVYEAPVKKLWLYVNGTRVADGTLNTPWQASGGVRLGGAKTAGAGSRFWPGGVDDVRLYQGILNQDQVSALYFSYPPQ